ncbi:MAG: OprO/OprP family phosphate-selective porin [Prevotella sp.]|uniref:porin n=1 Tax=Prevotella sp. TaxID=59823 RepID=UPI0025CD8A3E|nr:porin [Prevotella sp.]MCI7118475.1 OprO/OprP family phosphate-selective porin [Prevotella sp.]
MKILTSLALAALATISASAQDKKPQIQVLSDIKFSGYVMSQFQASDQEDKESNSFNIRMVRMALEGRLMQDFYWKVQIQANGNTSDLGSSPRMVDAFAEWQKYDAFKIKAGQFKRPFSFENPMHPITQGFMGYAQGISKLSGFSDRVGEHASNGRDIGVQIQGDFLKNEAGRNLVHYQIGVFNGQGTNQKDVDQRKDIIGGAWVMPIKGLRIGAFGWTGSYARKGTWKLVDENHQTIYSDPEKKNPVYTKDSKVRSLSMNRYAFSVEYAANDWTVRSEYIHSQGYGFEKSMSSGKETDCSINYAAGDKADGFYALMIAPVVSKKLYAKARYDLYRPRAEWSTSKTNYEIGANYWIGKSIMIGAEYVRVNDRSLKKHNYNMVDVELDVKF